MGVVRCPTGGGIITLDGGTEGAIGLVEQKVLLGAVRGRCCGFTGCIALALRQ